MVLLRPYMMPMTLKSVARYCNRITTERMKGSSVSNAGGTAGIGVVAHPQAVNYVASSRSEKEISFENKKSAGPNRVFCFCHGSCFSWLW